MHLERTQHQLVIRAYTLTPCVHTSVSSKQLLSVFDAKVRPRRAISACGWQPAPPPATRWSGESEKNTVECVQADPILLCSISSCCLPLLLLSTCREKDPILVCRCFSWAHAVRRPHSCAYLPLGTCREKWERPLSCVQMLPMSTCCEKGPIFVCTCPWADAVRRTPLLCVLGVEHMPQERPLSCVQMLPLSTCREKGPILVCTCRRAHAVRKTPFLCADAALESMLWEGPHFFVQYSLMPLANVAHDSWAVCVWP